MKTRKDWRYYIGKIIGSFIVGAIIGAVPAMFIILISSFSEDRPAFWIWPVFAAVCAVPIYFSLGD